MNNSVTTFAAVGCAVSLLGAVGCTSLPGGDDDGLENCEGTNSSTMRPLLCSPASTIEPGSMGSGPKIAGITGSGLHTGFIEGNEIIAGTSLGLDAQPHGVILAIDLKTGNRRIVSGEYPDPAQGPMVTGTGPNFDQVFDVEKGTDGWYASARQGVFRVDPVTGNRARLYDVQAEEATPYCEVGVLQVKPHMESLAVGPDNTVYVFAENGIVGNGLLAIRGDTCRKVSWVNPDPSIAVGTGPSWGGNVTHWMYRDGALWGVEFTSQSLFKVDPATGNRTRVSSSSAGVMVGTGSGSLGEIGDGGLAFENASTAIVTSFSSSIGIRLTEVDLATGNRTARPEKVHGPVNDGRGDTIGIWIPSSGPWVLGFNEALILYDPVTGNSNNSRDSDSDRRQNKLS